MARQTPKEPSGASDFKPLPTPSAALEPTAKRPGTSGTEALLVTNRRRASEKYQAAQRAEKTYKAKKRSAAARANYSEARAHFRESWHHFRAGWGMVFSVTRSVPYLFSERSEERRMKADEKKRKRQLEKRKKLEEELARENADGVVVEGKKNEEEEGEEKAEAA